MSTEKIIQQIKKDSENEIKQIKKDAETQAKQIITIAKKEAQKEAEKILHDGEKQGENQKKIQISKASQDAKIDTMNAREEIMEECFIKAHHKLSTLKPIKYKNTVRKLMKEGVRKLGKNCTVKVSRDIDREIAKDLGLQVTGKVESSGGIILLSIDGRITLDHTFDGILKREKDKIRNKVGKLLFS